MKATFKPLSLAVAVAAASAGYAGIVNAQAVTQLAGNSNLGDLAIVPYYTVQAGYSTGVNVINSSTETQVVKIRLRRQVDSMDALDFNVVLSPEDVWTGYVQKVGDDIRFFTNDNSCTVPALTDNYLQMPAIYRLGAEEGYIEVIGMGSADANQPISVSAKHATSGDTVGIPASCDNVRQNFFASTTYGAGPAAGQTKGVVNSGMTMQNSQTSVYGDTDNVLKVSWFIKSDITGEEIGDNAVNIANFMTGPTITNQQVGFNTGDLQGFDYPDLNGGAPTSSTFLGIGGVAGRGAYEPLRSVLGASEVINDWSGNTTDAFTVDTDWVVTSPGQYTMLNMPAYLESLAPKTGLCTFGTAGSAFDPTDGDNCDFRDLPLTVTAEVWDREERSIAVKEGDLVVSPQPPGEKQVVKFDQEVNVIQWGTTPVLGSAKNVIIPKPDGAQYGWAMVSVAAQTTGDKAICEFTEYGVAPTDQDVTCVSTSTPVPLVGFVAWQRNFSANPDHNYGRAIGHSYTSASLP
jgi:hypothetical protein